MYKNKILLLWIILLKCLVIFFLIQDIVKSNGKVRQRKETAEVVHTNGYDKETKLESKRNNGKAIGLIFISLLLDLLAFTMILPLLPSLLDYYDKQEGNSNTLYTLLLHAVQRFQKWTGAPDRFSSVLFGGALGSMYSFLQFLTSPIVGSLSDAYGRKPMLLICLVSQKFLYKNNMYLYNSIFYNTMRY